MPSTLIDKLPGPVREMLTDLWLSDEQTQGHPVLPPERVDLARGWLFRALLEADPLQGHLALLSRLYKGRFLQPIPRLLAHGERWAEPDEARGFRHDQPLAPEESQILVENGPDAYPPERLAFLLLNPVALWDVSDLIDSLLPAYWRPRVNRLGEELIAKHGLDFPIPLP
jgi:hypothetical protein